MKLSITKAIYDIGQTQFHKMLLTGSFPKINYHRDRGWEQYNMIEYSTTWASFMKVADIRIKEKTGDELGVFTRKHSLSFLTKIIEIFDNITEADVFAQPDRFRTMWD